jgi:hypothetical protein
MEHVDSLDKYIINQSKHRNCIFASFRSFRLLVLFS